MLSYSEIITSWLGYLELEELSNLNVEAKQLQDFRLRHFRSDRISESPYFENKDIEVRGKNYISIHIDERYFEELLKLREKKDQNGIETFYILFPLLEKKVNRDIVYIPLFILTFTDVIENLLGIPLDYKRKFVFSNEEVWPKKDLLLDDYRDYIVCKPAFRTYLGYEDEEIDRIFSGKSLLVGLRELIGVEEDTDFFELLRKLKELITLKLNEIGGSGYSQTLKVSFYDYIILDGNVKIIQNDRIKKQLTILKNQEFDPSKRKNSAAYEFLYGIIKEDIQKVFNDYNKPDDTYWFGNFHRYKLSYGQSLVLQKYAKGEKLIAVQGPPGTGKTTLLMALIAQTITMRALSIILGKGDYSSVILVTSTANKAVENAAREFKDNPVLEAFDIYKNGGFYFSFIGGKKGDFNASIKRLEMLKEFLKQADVEIAKKNYPILKEKIALLYSLLKQRIDFIVEKKREFSKIKEELIKLNEEKRELEKQLNEYYAKRDEYLRELSILGIKDITDVRNVFSDYKMWLSKYEAWLSKYKIKHLNYEDMQEIVNSKIDEDSLELFTELHSQSLIRKILNLIYKQNEKKILLYIRTYKHLLEKLGFNLDINQKIKVGHFKGILKDLLEMVDDLKKLFNSLKYPILFQNDELFKLLADCIEVDNKYGETLKKLEEIKEILTKVEHRYLSISCHYLFRYIYDSEGVFNYVRSIYNRMRVLFLSSLKFLEYYAIINRERILEALDLFIKLMGDDLNDYITAKKKILQKGIDEFYKDLSLVCPVFLSSLSSSPFLFDKFIHEGGTQSELVKRDFKPIKLLFIDEAGMALPHLGYPAIYWSDQVICVGDPLQLEPVVAIDGKTIEEFHKKFYSDRQEDIDRYSPARVSLYHRAARCNTGDPSPSNIGQAYFLDTHRRCQKPIAELFSKIAGYKNLEIKTPELSGEKLQRLEKFGGQHLVFYDVRGISGNDKNTNLGEVWAIKSICKKLKEAGFDLKKEVGVITPYVKQEALLKRALKGEIPEKHIGTIHKFQGTEFPVVIMSSVVYRDTDSTGFIDRSPNLLNVAVSRAKEVFILVGNKKRLETTRYFGEAIRFISEKGVIIEGVEFDESDERRRKKESLEKTVVEAGDTELLSDAKRHLEYFNSLPEKVKKKVLIVSPWITYENLSEYSFPILKILSDRGVEVKIIYGFSDREQDKLDELTEKLLLGLKNIKIERKPNCTHAKLLVIDDEEAVITSFNWLSQRYYKYIQDERISRFILRDEVGLLTRNRKILKELFKVVEGN